MIVDQVGDAHCEFGRIMGSYPISSHPVNDGFRSGAIETGNEQGKSGGKPFKTGQ